MWQYFGDLSIFHKFFTLFNFLPASIYLQKYLFSRMLISNFNPSWEPQILLNPSSLSSACASIPPKTVIFSFVPCCQLHPSVMVICNINWTTWPVATKCFVNVTERMENMEMYLYHSNFIAVSLKKKFSSNLEVCHVKYLEAASKKPILQSRHQ
jgi:hypothetical protein